MKLILEVGSCVICPLLKENNYGFRYCTHPDIGNILPEVNDTKSRATFPKNCPGLKKED